MVGRTLGHYEIIEPLGAGGMGEVYRAHDTTLKRDVAIKVLPEDLSADVERLARLEREAQLLAALNHHNIEVIYGLEESDGIRFMALELIEGESLAEIISRGPIEVEQALNIARQIAEALKAAHAKGIIHRDLKPANVVITPEGQAKVLDFGLAKSGGAEGEDPEASPDLTKSPTVALATMAGVILGTAAYMSPEQARGKPLDTRTDIWSFGCVLYEMLTGRGPFVGETVTDVLAAIVHVDPDWEALPPATPEATRSLLRRCLSKDLDQRTPDIADASIEIAEALRPDGIFSLPVTRLSARSRRALLATAGILAVAAAVLVVLVGVNIGGLREQLLGTGSRSSQRLAVLPLRDLMGDPQQEYFAEGLQEALSTELNKIGALEVVSHTSTLRYKDTDTPLPQIARELNVDLLVTGSVLRERDQVGITIQLIDGPSERILWANPFDREMRGILALYRDAARAIADAIRVELTPQEQTLLASAQFVDPEAYEAYLEGRYYSNQYPVPGFDRCEEHLREAIEKDPSFADAYAALASCYVQMSWVTRPKDVVPLAKAAAERALEIDPNNGEAFATLGGANHVFEWDWVAAEQNLSRALELSPNSAKVHLSRAAYFANLGRSGVAIREAKKAVELDPESVSRNRFLAFVYLLSRQYENYAEQSRATLQLTPENTWVSFDLAWAYALQGMREEALAIVNEEDLGLLLETLVLGTLGERERARQSFELLSEQLKQQSEEQYTDPFWVALAYVAVGERDAALQLLEQAYEERSTSMVQLKTNPGLDPLRDDPRFQDLLRRMNFPG